MAAGLWADEAKTPKPKPNPAHEAAKQATPETKSAKEDDYELQKAAGRHAGSGRCNYVKNVTRRELVEAAIKGVLEKLDPYSSYISPDELTSFRSSVESEFGGIGIQVSVEGGQLRVISPLVGTPAYLGTSDAFYHVGWAILENPVHFTGVRVDVDAAGPTTD